MPRPWRRTVQPSAPSYRSSRLPHSWVTRTIRSRVPRSSHPTHLVLSAQVDLLRLEVRQAHAEEEAGAREAAAVKMGELQAQLTQQVCTHRHTRLLQLLCDPACVLGGGKLCMYIQALSTSPARRRLISIRPSAHPSSYIHNSSIHLSTRACTHARIHACTCTHAHMHMHMHTHTCTHARPLRPCRRRLPRRWCARCYG